MPTSILQWISLVGIIWLQSINGTNSDFPAYSPQLKRLLSISQVQLNNLAFASDAGKLFGWLAGVAAIHLPIWILLLVGSVLGLVGYGVQYLFLISEISSPLSYWQIFLLTVLAGNSICWINTICYVVAIKNFPNDHQVAVGLSTSYVGLSASVYTNIVDAISGSDHNPEKKAKTYLLLNAIVPVIVSIITAPLVRKIDGKKKGNQGMKVGFFAMFGITIATGVFAVFSSLGLISKASIGMGLLLAAPLLVPLIAEVRVLLQEFWRIKREKRVHVLSVDEEGKGDRVEIEIEIEMREERDGEGEGEGEEEDKIAVKEEIGVKLMIKRLDFWLYFFAYMFSVTLGLVFLNNLGQIAESRGNNASSLVSFSSSFGFFGRLIPSILDYFFSKSKCMISRPASIVTLMAPMAASFFLLLNTRNISLYISTAIIGVCTGAITSLAVSTTPELFGTKNFSVNHNVLITNIPVGSYLFGYMAAVLYQEEENENGRCMGFQCHKKIFIIWGSICVLGTLLGFVLYARTRKFYEHRS